MHKFTYLFINFLCYLIPAIYTLIHKKPLFKRGYYFINKSTLIAALPFLVWDIIAIYRNHWQFNPELISGWKILVLPVEEVFFMILIPQSCLILWILFSRYQKLNLKMIFKEHKKRLL